MPPTGDRLDILATLIESYEDRRWRIEDLEGGAGPRAAPEFAAHRRERFQLLRERERLDPWGVAARFPYMWCGK